MSTIPPFSRNYNIEVCGHVHGQDNTFDPKTGELYTQLDQPCLLGSIGKEKYTKPIFIKK